MVAAHDTVVAHAADANVPIESRELTVPLTFATSVNEAYLQQIDAAAINIIDNYAFGPLRSNTLSVTDLKGLTLADGTAVPENTVGLTGTIDLTKYNGDTTVVSVVFRMTKGAAVREYTKDITFPKSQNQMDLDSLIAANFSVAATLGGETAPTDGTVADIDNFNAISLIGSETQGVEPISAVINMESDDAVKGTITLTIGKGTARRDIDFDVTYGHSRN